MNLPNKLTILRIIMIPFFIAAFYLPESYAWVVTSLLFLVAYATDYVDGWLARKLDQITVFGKFMDPIADKLLTISALVMLLVQGSVSPIILILVIGREFIVSGIRLVVASGGTVIAASWLGKAKTMSQFIAIQLALLEPILQRLFGEWVSVFIQILLWISTILTVWSGWDYVNQHKAFILQTK
jgi:CDP-diacylglycerol--glycerol-3-phosphate 3-phosphatidyltransferase